MVILTFVYQDFSCIYIKLFPALQMTLIPDNSKHSNLPLEHAFQLQYSVAHLYRRVTATMSQDNDTPKDCLDVAYRFDGAFQLEAYEFGKFFIPFLKDESTDTSQ